MRAGARPTSSGRRRSHRRSGLRGVAGRGTETEEKIQTRLKNARTEMAYQDKPGFFDCVIVNDDLDAAYGTLKAICVPAA